MKYRLKRLKESYEKRNKFRFVFVFPADTNLDVLNILDRFRSKFNNFDNSCAYYLGIEESTSNMVCLPDNNLCSEVHLANYRSSLLYKDCENTDFLTKNTPLN